MHARQLMKTEMCKFFLANRCGKGTSCAFAHSLGEIREKPDLERTSMCRAFLQSGNCANPRCTFAHCERELRTTSSFHKTKMCRFAPSGRCKHGHSCRFAHTLNELNGEAPSMADAPSRGGSSDADATSTCPGSSTPGRCADFYSGPGSLGQGPCRPQQSMTAWDQTDVTSDYSGRTNPFDQNGSSDLSTKADTSATLPTPEGSGDSGQEELAAGGQQTRRNVAGAMGGGPSIDERGRRMERRSGGRHCTTVMLTNVPNFLTQGALISLFEDLTACMRGAFDFFYCPWDPQADCNLGYAIINFFSRTVAAEFEQQWSKQPLLPRTSGSKRLRIVPAALQGRAANLRHFSGFGLAHHADARFRPLVRAGPNEELRPMATATEIAQSSSQFTAMQQQPIPQQQLQLQQQLGQQQVQMRQQHEQLGSQHQQQQEQQRSPQQMGQHQSYNYDCEDMGQQVRSNCRWDNFDDQTPRASPCFTSNDHFEPQVRLDMFSRTNEFNVSKAKASGLQSTSTCEGSWMKASSGLQAGAVSGPPATQWQGGTTQQLPYMFVPPNNNAGWAVSADQLGQTPYGADPTTFVYYACSPGASQDPRLVTQSSGGLGKPLRRR